MSQNEQAIEWFLAREGQRHGPISDMEMRKLIELGHLKPTDLVWRQGFANWEQAGDVFAGPKPRPATPAPQPQAQPAAEPQPAPQRPAPAQQQNPAASPPRPQMPAPVARPAPQPTAPAPASVRTADAEAATSIDPLRHRRIPQDPQTRRTSGYGDTPPYAQAPAPGQPHPGNPHHGPQQVGMATSGGPAALAQGQQPRQPGSFGPLEPQMQQVPQDPARQSSRPAPVPARKTVDDRSLQPAAVKPDVDLGEDPFDPPKKRRMPWRMLAATIVLAMVGGAIYSLAKSGRLSAMLTTNKSATPATGPGANSAPAPAARAVKASYKESPLKGYSNVADEVDNNFQKSGLWQLLKKEFPDWYAEAVSEVSKLKGAGTDDRTLSLHLTKRLVEFRRKNSANAFAATPAALQRVAQTFVDNLGALSRVSTEACYRFISAGETDAMMVELMRSAEHAATMQEQMAAVFEAIADGRRAKGKISPADRKDYDVLATQLSLRGWSPADLALFDDARALSQAPPQKVCQMVQDWFAAQLAVKDQSVQMRLFGATLKPLIGD